MKQDEQNKLLLRIRDLLIKKFEIVKKVVSDWNFKLRAQSKYIDNRQKRSMKEEEKSSSASNGGFVRELTEEIFDENEEDEDEDSEQNENSIQNCNRILRFLQLLTENHHPGLQNHLRIQ